MFVLPTESRKLFKDPFGTLHQDIGTVLPELAGHTVYSVGDVVTHSLQQNGITPAIAVVDGQTMRTPCTKMPHLSGTCIRVKNPPGTITDELVDALTYAVDHTPVTIIVDGEEDLAVIPLVIAAPLASVVLYGQPNEGVVLRVIDDRAKAAACNLLGQFARTDARPT
ncbi:MAG: GTP-dependent dephospho-CoA kinase family protein [Methanoregula sp.]|uniref:GTP-dependent dephospho-CoA kinase family protein n=1 Tax=Methanoregula sp. TaxID=2052170 RepID=UPI003BAE7FC4